MNQNPKDWKTYDEFAYGIDTNRLPATEALTGSTHKIAFDDGRRLELSFAKGEVKWSDGKDSGTDLSEVIEVAPKTYFVEIIFAGRPREAETLILNTETRRVLSIYSVVRELKDSVGEPQVAQIFRPGVIEGDAASGPVPHRPRPDRAQGSFHLQPQSCLRAHLSLVAALCLAMPCRCAARPRRC